MRKFTLFFLLLLVAAVTFASPAYRKPKKVTQSDGTVLTVVFTGDEAMHYYVTLDGKPLVKEANGDFCYATFTSGKGFESTRLLAHDEGSRALYEKSFLASIDYNVMKDAIAEDHSVRAAKFRSAPRKAGSSVNPEGEVNVAVVLVEFQDYKFSYTKEDISNVMNAKDFKYDNPIAETVGSARDYFIAQSGGKFRPNFIVSDIVTLDNNMAYYGGNDSKGNDLRAPHAVKEGIQKADATFDFSICDNDGDGEVEFVYCIYAGYSESYGASANTIWPHQWQLRYSAGTVTVDGVMCDTYACSSELLLTEAYESQYGKLLTGIGTICHEFSHCLGLPDIYDTSGNSLPNWGMEYWDIMDCGNYAAEGYVPVGYNSYQRDFCGWNDLEVLETKGDYSMEALTRGGKGYKIINDANPNEYYILENRKCEGWDTYLFGEGMLVMHIDYLKSAWDNNTVNNTPGHTRFTLIPADNELLSFYASDITSADYSASLRGDIWPGPSGNTELTNTSFPAAKVYTGGYMNKPIHNIKYENDIVSFHFLGGVFEAAPAVLPATEVTETSFVANWESAGEGLKYIVELRKVTDVGEGEGDPVGLLTEDFLGFTKTNADVSSTINDYTSASGWTGSRIYSEGGVLRVGAASSAGWLRTPVMNAEGSVSVALAVSLYNSADTGSQLTVVIKDTDDNAIASKDFTPSSSPANCELAADVSGDFYVEFNTSGSTGKKRANIDNVNVSVASSSLSEVVSTVETENVSHKFEGLEAGCNYRYRVQANDGYGSSEFSQYQVVTTPTSIDDIVAENGYVEVYSLSGIRLYAGEKSALPALEKGVYIIKSAGKKVKLFVE